MLTRATCAQVEEVKTTHFSDYQQRAIETNGDSFLVRGLTYVAYPGALAGAGIYNTFLSPKKDWLEN